LILLAFYTLFTLNEIGLLVPIFIFNLVLLAYEIYQMGVCGMDYLTDMWNYLDIVRCGLCMFYIFLIWSGEIGTLSNHILVILTLVSWIRCITFFRLFEDTRYMIQLIQEVFVDIKSFFFLLFYSTIAFALVFIAIKNDSNTSFFDNLASSYLLDLADFSTDGQGTLEWIIFFFASVINPLVMLNLLISIIGDTYDRV